MLNIFHLTKVETLDFVPKYVEEVFCIDNLKVKNQLTQVFQTFIDDLFIITEFPYVEKYYRDSYYTYFSKKHKVCERDTIRLSFFSINIKDADFFNADEFENIQENFYGFLTIRPTTYRIIGHTFFSPKILKTNSFVCCLSRKSVLVNGIDLMIHGFPFCSQDNESITCSESVLLNIMDYFCHKYPDYSILMPSKINRILENQSYERQLPSKGLPLTNISFTLKELGFGSVVYSKDGFKDRFKDLLYLYIESGIPIVLILENEKSNVSHAIIAIGREIKTNYQFASSQEDRLKFSDAFESILVMNDNHSPYEIANFLSPCTDFKINSFIVPLYSKVHMDGFQFLCSFDSVIKLLSNQKETKHITFFEKGKKHIIKYFLTSSKSYKKYISSSKGLSTDFKSILVDKCMPKFIWIAEIINGESIEDNQPISGIMCFDATESGENSYRFILAFSSNHLILKDVNHLIIDDKGKNIDRNSYTTIRFNSETFITFANNLKGKHTKWQS